MNDPEPARPLDYAMKIIWAIAQEAGGEITLQVDTLSKIQAESGIQITPSADGLKLHVKALV